MRIQRPELGLRARVTLAFAGGALALSTALSGVTYGLVRNYLLQQTETAALRETFANAGVTRDGLRTLSASLPRILASLQDPDGSPSLVFHDDNWFSSNPLAFGRESLPAAFRQAVNAGHPSHQAYRLAGSTRFAIGLPLPGVQATYFEVFSLDQVEVLKVLGMVNAVPEFTDQPKVINGCSDLFVAVLGERGRHARSAVGMGSLPVNIPVEIEAVMRVVG